MKIVIATPSARPALTGNATTAERWARGLRARGHEVRVVACPAEWQAEDFRRAVTADGGADVIHLLHAWKCGRFVEEARALAPRVVVSFAGTDLAPSLDEEHLETVRRACERAHALVAAGEDGRAVVARALPDLAPRVASVPKGVLLGHATFDLRHGSDELFVVLPAGVRAVKRPRLPIGPLERLRAEGLAVRYVVVGPELESGESAALRETFASRSWCSRVAVEPDAVPSVLAAADLVLNVSVVEGFANALAEALAAGCCVLASDVPGNRAALGGAGVLFTDEADFTAKARALLRDPSERRRLAAAAKLEAARRFDPARELDALLAVYRR